MKLYIWNDPYYVSFGGSFLFAIAPDLVTAKRIANNAVISEFGSSPGKRHVILDLGEPDRVIDAPYAECYEWCE